MSEATKKRHTKGVDIVINDEEQTTFRVPKNKLAKVLPLIKEYEVKDSVSWETLAEERIKKYSKPGIALKGARTKEGLSQIDLAKKLGVAQYNISKMENGKRAIGKEMAKRLAKILKVDYRIFL